MTLFTAEQTEELIHNGQPGWTRDDHYPVAKLYIPDTQCVWLFTELKPDNPNKGLALFVDDGMTTYHHLDIQQLMEETPRIYPGKSLTIDPDFSGEHPISTYRFAAETLGYIIDDPDNLSMYMRRQKTFQYRP
jgi:hypothetical protein